MSAKERFLVIGIGNPDRGDDGVGPLVSRSLEDCMKDIRVLSRDSDMLALLEDWAETDHVFLIDATTTLSAPGRVHRIDLAQEELPRELSFSSTHALDVGHTIALARTLGRLPPHVILYAIEGKCFEPGSAMSPEVMTAIAEVSDCIHREIATFCDTR